MDKKYRAALGAIMTLPLAASVAISGALPAQAWPTTIGDWARLGDVVVEDTFVDAEGNIFIANAHPTQSSIMKVSASGDVDRSFIPLTTGLPAAVATTSTGTVVSVSPQTNSVTVVPETGRTSTLPLPSTGRPLEVIPDHLGNAYILNRVIGDLTYGDTVSKLDATGVLTPRFATIPGTITAVDGVADSKGNLWILDASGKIFTVQPDGTSAHVNSAALTRDAHGITIDKHDNVYVSTGWRHTVERLSPDGSISVIAKLPHSTGSMHDLAVDDDGNVYVSTDEALYFVTCSGYFTPVERDAANPIQVADLTIALSKSGTALVGISMPDLAPHFSYGSGEARGYVGATLAVAPTGFAPDAIFSLTAGSLPPGVGLDSKTGTISGKPSASGTYFATVRVENSAGHFDSNLTLIVRSDRAIY